MDGEYKKSQYSLYKMCQEYSKTQIIKLNYLHSDIKTHAYMINEQIF